MRKLSFKMIKWLDLKFAGFSNPAESLNAFAKEFDMTFDEADKLFRVWMNVEDHRNWHNDLEGDDECEEEGGSWHE
jgi:hypothetical protein